jgi:hypothetical protein
MVAECKDTNNSGNGFYKRPFLILSCWVSVDETITAVEAYRLLFYKTDWLSGMSSGNDEQVN